MISLEKEMEIYSSILAYRILLTEEPCRLQFIGSLRVGCDLAYIHTHFNPRASKASSHGGSKWFLKLITLRKKKSIVAKEVESKWLKKIR